MSGEVAAEIVHRTDPRLGMVPPSRSCAIEKENPDGERMRQHPRLVLDDPLQER